MKASAHTKPYSNPSFRTPTSPEVVAAFAEMEQELLKSTCFNHPLFKYMDEQSRSKGLTSEQFRIFRDSMFRRIHHTMGHIANLAKDASDSGDRETLVTAARNFQEEMSNAKGVEHTHASLCERAFNSTGDKIFGLYPVWMTEAIGITGDSTTGLSRLKYKFQLPEEVAYDAVVSKIYAVMPTVASWINERASGGDDVTHKGMMGDMFQLFSSYQFTFEKGEFEKNVLPYFAEHLSIKKNETNGRFEIVNDGQSIEFQHGQRAREDAVRFFKTAEEVRAAIPAITAFADAQSRLFDAILQKVRVAERIGTPIKATESQEMGREVSQKGLTTNNVVAVSSRIARL